MPVVDVGEEGEAATKTRRVVRGDDDEEDDEDRIQTRKRVRGGSGEIHPKGK